MNIEDYDAFLVTASYEGKQAKAIFCLTVGEWEKYPEQLKKDTIMGTIEEVAFAELGDVPFEVSISNADTAVLDLKPYSDPAALHWAL